MKRRNVDENQSDRIYSRISETVGFSNENETFPWSSGVTRIMTMVGRKRKLSVEWMGKQDTLAYSTEPSGWVAPNHARTWLRHYHGEERLNQSRDSPTSG